MSESSDSLGRLSSRLASFRIKAGLAPVFETCMILQVVCVFLAFYMATRNQTAAVIATAVACAFVIPLMGILLLSLLDREDEDRGSGLGSAESVIESIVAVIISILCITSFFPRWGKFAEKNPYSNKETLQCIVQFVIGEQFVVPGSLQSDGLIMKVPEGQEVMPPSVLPKPGLTFVGWRYAGTGDPDIAVGTPIYLDANGTRNNSVTLYAEYVDADGNAYCACGAVGEKAFDGASWQSMNTRHFLITFIPIAGGSAIVIANALLRRRKKDAEEPEGEKKPEEQTDDEDVPANGSADDGEDAQAKEATGDDEDAQVEEVTDDENAPVADAEDGDAIETETGQGGQPDDEPTEPQDVQPDESPDGRSDEQVWPDDESSPDDGSSDKSNKHEDGDGETDEE